MAHVVIADDNRTTTKTLCTLVERWGHQATQAFDGKEAMAALESQGADVLITDLRMPEMDGLELLRHVVDRWPDVVIIVATAYGSIETAVEAMKLGAFDFLTKPYDDKELRAKVEKAVAQREMVLQLERMNARIESFEADSRPGMGEIIGTSPAMGRVFRTGQQGGRDRRHGAAVGREWNGEGAGGAGDSRSERPARRALRARPLCRLRRRSARERALWP
jgi:DNA-binding NtrC family response regulator